MGKIKIAPGSSIKSRSRPASNLENREDQLASLAMDLVEERLLNGTATSQEVCYFLKAASTKERQQKEKLENEIELLKAKVEYLQSTKRSEEIYADAIRAMKIYSGNYDSDIDE